jgi:hypothetical protein
MVNAEKYYYGGVDRGERSNYGLNTDVLWYRYTVVNITVCRLAGAHS